LIQLVAQSVLGTELISQKAPLAAVAGILLGPWGSSMLIICAVIAIFGSLNSLVLIFSRVVFAGAKDGLLPGFLAKVHPRFATPHWAVGVFSLLAFIVAISGGFRQLIVLATLSVLFIHAGVALAVIRFRLFPVDKSPGNFTLPGGIAIPVVALAALTWFIFQSKSNEVMGIAVFSVVLTVLYAFKVLARRF
jgi:amino acid transporter